MFFGVKNKRKKLKNKKWNDTLTNSCFKPVKLFFWFLYFGSDYIIIYYLQRERASEWDKNALKRVNNNNNNKK